VAEAVSLPGLDERSVRLPLHIPSLPEREDVQIVNAGFLFGSDRPHVQDPPPRLGEHSAAILEELGFSAEERKAILD
jgi:crotonobetainyl-CoA:carnitine CoA-transferase CaiB-like acyl-CoA transferase